MENYEIILGIKPVPEHLYARSEKASAVNDKRSQMKGCTVIPRQSNNCVWLNKEQRDKLRTDITALLEMGVWHSRTIYNMLQTRGKIPRLKTNGNYLSFKSFSAYVTDCNKASGNKYFTNIKRKSA